MKTIAEQLNIKDFPFKIKDKLGNVIYFENSNGYWLQYQFDSKGNEDNSRTIKCKRIST